MNSRLSPGGGGGPQPGDLPAGIEIGIEIEIGIGIEIVIGKLVRKTVGESEWVNSPALIRACMFQGVITLYLTA
jgi:hypothetical protein